MTAEVLQFPNGNKPPVYEIGSAEHLDQCVNGMVAKFGAPITVYYIYLAAFRLKVKLMREKMERGEAHETRIPRLRGLLRVRNRRLRVY